MDDQDTLPPPRERRKKLLKPIKDSRENLGKAEREALKAEPAEQVRVVPGDMEPGTLQPLPDLGGAWWTIPEAYVWLQTRDGRFIAQADDRARHSLFIAGEIIEADAARLEGAPLWLPVRLANQRLENAFRDDDIEITGRLRGEGGQVRIEPKDWLSLELTMDADGSAIASARSLISSDPCFDNLYVRAQGVRSKWPWHHHPAALLPWHDADGLPDMAETMLADAWRWCLSKAAMWHDNGPSRVGWKDLGDLVERKLFNAFTERDLECFVRLDPEEHTWSTAPGDWFRLAIEINPQHNKLQAHTQADMAEYGPAWEKVRTAVGYQVNVKALRRWWATVEAMKVPASAPESVPATPMAPTAVFQSFTAIWPAVIASSPPPADAAEPREPMQKGGVTHGDRKAQRAARKEQLMQRIVAWAKPCIERIVADKLRLSKGQFVCVVERQYGAATPINVTTAAWKLAAAPEWQEEGIGAIKVVQAVSDDALKAYFPTEPESK